MLVVGIATALFVDTAAVETIHETESDTKFVGTRVLADIVAFLGDGLCFCQEMTHHISNSLNTKPTKSNGRSDFAIISLGDLCKVGVPLLVAEFAQGADALGLRLCDAIHMPEHRLIMKHLEIRMADPLKRASRFTALRVAVAQMFCHATTQRISSVALRDGYQHRDEAAIIAQAEAVLAKGDGKENAQAYPFGGLCAGAVNLQLRDAPVRHITGTIDVQFLKGETIVDPNVVMKTRIPYEEEQFASLGSWLFIMFAINDMFAVPWAEALEKRRFALKEGAKQWPVLPQIDKANAIFNDKEAGTTAFSRFFKQVARECGLNVT
ncbi:hypothetical protein HDU86_007275 [Geranomyces michiganensis]|nr:hypothetical protein HDU86_007275 [Geranomyces michiganensis]